MCSIYFYFCVLLMVLQAFGFERKLTTRVNPGCKKCSSVRPFIHVTADSELDTIHHLWDFTGKPSVLVAHTPLNTQLNIDWTNYPFDGRQGSLNFSVVPDYMFTIILEKIIDFEDVNNTGIYKNDTVHGHKDYLSEHFNWNLTSLHNDSQISEATILGSAYLSKNSRVTGNNQLGTINIKLSAFGIKEHSRAEPHLFHTTNTTQMEIGLDSFSVSYAQSRFALQFIAVSSDKSNATVSLKTHKTLDDEHSPGVFTVAEYLTPGSEDGSLGGGYLQWRTVAYTSKERSIVNTTTTHESFPYTVPNPLRTIKGSLIYSLVGSLLQTMSVHTFFVSFGATDDAGYYAKTNYLSWSFLIGYGQPAGEIFSLLFVVLISVCLNLISLLAVVAYVLIFTRRIRRNKNDLFYSH